MFKKILLSTDFSAYAERLWECLPELKKMGIQEVLGVHVTPLTGAVKYADFAVKKLSLREEAVKEAGLKYKFVVRTGVAAQEINEVAEENNADLILVGARGESRFRHSFLGSTALDLARTASRPILMEKYGKEGKDSEPCRDRFRRILLPLDFSADSMGVYNIVLEGKVPAEEVLLVHVVERARTEKEVEEYTEAAQQRLHKLADELENAGVRSHAHVLVGVPSLEISSLVDKENISLIMMATRGAGKVKELLLGSSAQNVLSASKAPILLFPVHKDR